MGSFLIRFLLYLVVLGFVTLASVATNDLSQNAVSPSNKATKKLIIFSYAMAILIGAVTIVELATFHFDKWIYMRISLYLFSWLVPVYIFVDLKDHKILNMALEMAVLTLAVFLFATAIYGFCQT